jgi:hypothetical protein
MQATSSTFLLPIPRHLLVRLATGDDRTDGGTSRRGPRLRVDVCAALLLLDLDKGHVRGRRSYARQWDGWSYAALSRAWGEITSLALAWATSHGRQTGTRLAQKALAEWGEKAIESGDQTGSRPDHDRTDTGSRPDQKKPIEGDEAGFADHDRITTGSRPDRERTPSIASPSPSPSLSSSPSRARGREADHKGDGAPRPQADAAPDLAESLSIYVKAFHVLPPRIWSARGHRATDLRAAYGPDPRKAIVAEVEHGHGGTRADRLAAWRETVAHWRAKGWSHSSVGKLLDRYAQNLSSILAPTPDPDAEPTAQPDAIARRRDERQHGGDGEPVELDDRIQASYRRMLASLGLEEGPGDGAHGDSPRVEDPGEQGGRRRSRELSVGGDRRRRAAHT